MRSLRTTAILLILTSAAFGQTDVRKVADRLDQHYNHIDTLQVDFTETYRGAGVNRAETGTLLLKADGSFTYTPDRDFVGLDSFTYTIASGGATSAPATVTLAVK